jgi:hypothetical protein
MRKGAGRMERVKTAFEKAMEKIQGIEALTPEEKAEMKDREKIREVLSGLYRGQLKRDEIWERLKGSKPSLLREAQLSMADSLRLSNLPEEFKLRKEGLLAVEALKDKQNLAVIEGVLTAIDKLRREYGDVKERALEQVRRAVEQNPQLRMRTVRTADGRAAQVSMSVDEAVLEKAAEFLPEHEKRYEAMFAQAVERLKKELR